RKSSAPARRATVTWSNAKFTRNLDRPENGPAGRNQGSFRGPRSGVPGGGDGAGNAGALQPAIAVGVLGQILLMLGLGVIEGRRRQDLGGDLRAAGRLQRGL